MVPFDFFITSIHFVIFLFFFFLQQNAMITMEIFWTFSYIFCYFFTCDVYSTWNRSITWGRLWWTLRETITLWLRTFNRNVKHFIDLIFVWSCLKSKFIVGSVIKYNKRFKAVFFCLNVSIENFYESLFVLDNIDHWPKPWWS